jgi:hypothetical protein
LPGFWPKTMAGKPRYHSASEFSRWNHHHRRMAQVNQSVLRPSSSRHRCTTTEVGMYWCPFLSSSLHALTICSVPRLDPWPCLSTWEEQMKCSEDPESFDGITGAALGPSLASLVVWPFGHDRLSLISRVPEAGRHSSMYRRTKAHSKKLFRYPLLLKRNWHKKRRMVGSLEVLL